jgi:hypothetical protein
LTFNEWRSIPSWVAQAVFSKPTLKTLFEVLGSAIIMGYISHISLDVFDDLFNINTFWGIFLQGFFSGLIGISSSITVLYLLGNKELSEVWTTLHKKIWRAKVVPPDAELG